MDKPVVDTSAEALAEVVSWRTTIQANCREQLSFRLTDHENEKADWRYTSLITVTVQMKGTHQLLWRPLQ